MNEIGERHADMIARTGLESSLTVTCSETSARFAAPESPPLIEISPLCRAPRRSFLRRPQPSAFQRHDAVEAVGKIKIVHRDQQGEAGLARNRDVPLLAAGKLRYG
jgi:hypothetical protein